MLGSRSGPANTALVWCFRASCWASHQLRLLVRLQQISWGRSGAENARLRQNLQHEVLFLSPHTQAVFRPFSLFWGFFSKIDENIRCSVFSRGTTTTIEEHLPEAHVSNDLFIFIFETSFHAAVCLSCCVPLQRRVLSSLIHLLLVSGSGAHFKTCLHANFESIILPDEFWKLYVTPPPPHPQHMWM